MIVYMLYDVAEVSDQFALGVYSSLGAAMSAIPAFVSAEHPWEHKQWEMDGRQFECWDSKRSIAGHEFSLSILPETIDAPPYLEQVDASHLLQGARV